MVIWKMNISWLAVAAGLRVNRLISQGEGTVTTDPKVQRRLYELMVLMKRRMIGSARASALAR